jgi:hypothetical protein
VYCDGAHAALIQKSQIDAECPVYTAVSNLTPSMCGYAPETTVRGLAMLSTTVRLADDGLSVSSMDSCAIDALRSSGNWQNANCSWTGNWTFEYNASESLCLHPASSLWPAMYHGCGIASAVHWVPVQRHMRRYEVGRVRSSSSSTNLLMLPPCSSGTVGHPATGCHLCTSFDDCSDRAAAVTDDGFRNACVCTCAPGWDGMQCSHNTSFFLAPLPTINDNLNIQANCRTACANISNDDAQHLRGYVAWILSEDEDMAVHELTKTYSNISNFVLGGNRRTPSGGIDGSIWYWTEFPAQWIAHDARGLPFYNGTTWTNGSALRYANFSAGEPNMYDKFETQLTFLATGGWNDARNDQTARIAGCVCRRWAAVAATPTSTTEIFKSTTVSHSLVDSLSTTQTEVLTSKVFSQSFSSTALLTSAASSITFSQSNFMSESRSAHQTADTQSFTRTHSGSASASHWQCVAAVDSVALSLETLADAVAAGDALGAKTGIVAVLLSQARHAHATVEAPMHVPVVQLTSNPVERSVLRAHPPLGLNISLESPLDAVVHWSAANVTLDNETNLNFTAYTSNTLPWNTCCFSPQQGGWVDAATPVLEPRTLVLTVTMICDGAAVLVVRVTVPAPGTPRTLAAKVEAAGGYSQIASVLAGGASSGAALGRTMATRSMVLCDADASVSGGVVDLGVVVCAAADGRPHQAALAAARSAVVSNVVLLCAVSLAMMGVVCLWAALARVAVGAATRVVCLPSSLLPVRVAVVPTSTSGAVLLLSRLGSSSCVAADVSMSAVGLVIGVAPALLFVVCWGWKVRGGASAAWRCVERQPAALEDKLPLGPGTASRVPQLLVTVRRVVMRRRFEWASADGSREGLAPMWPVLLEYRDLRYGAVDCGVLASVSCIAVVSGLTESAAPCRAWSFASVVLLLMQLVLLVVMRPFSSLFAAVHGVAALSLTVIGVLTQLVFVWASAASSSRLWLVQASSMCSLAIVGLSATKMLVDLFQLRKAAVRRVAELHEVRVQLKAADESRLKGLMPASSGPVDTVLEMKLLLLVDDAEEGGAALDDARVDGGAGAEDAQDGSAGAVLKDFDYVRFWDASGAAVGTEVVASLLTQWEA